MNYLEIVYIVFYAMSALLGLMLIHYVFFTLVGIFARKKFPEAEEKCSFGIVIAARNEERVIARLIESIRRNKYPQDKVKIFVVAHNCTDKTAEISRNAGAIVYEYNNPDERTVGYAYKHIFGKINADYGTKAFDGFMIINADNVLKENYLSKMNDAFVANGKSKIITSYRNSKNFSENYMSCLYGIFFIAACRFESRGRTVCGCSTRVSGTGYLFNSELVTNGWEYVTITEDWEFSADIIARGSKIYHCDEAEFYDEQPTTVKIMLRQRFRWAKGHLDVFRTRFKKVASSFFHPQKYGGGKNRFSKYDIGTEILPLGVISVSMFLIQMILLALSPLFGFNAGRVFARYFIIFGIGFGISYVITVISGLLLFLLERKRIGRVGVFNFIVTLLLWPFFLLLNVWLDVCALFVKKLEWKPIPHSYNSEQIENQQSEAKQE